MGIPERAVTGPQETSDLLVGRAPSGPAGPLPVVGARVDEGATDPTVVALSGGVWGSDREATKGHFKKSLSTENKH